MSNARDLMRSASLLGPGDSLKTLSKTFLQPAVRAIAVVDEQGNLKGSLTEQDLLEALIPPYVRDDESLAAVLPQSGPGELLERITRMTVGDLVSASTLEHPIVRPEDTLLEVISALVGSGAPAAFVVEEDQVLGVITVDHLLSFVLGSSGK